MSESRRRVLPNIAWALLCLWSMGCQAGSGTSVKDNKNCQRVKEGYGPVGKAQVRAEVVAEGLEVPWALAFLPDGSILVTERKGPLRLIKDGELVEDPLVEVPVLARGEGGLMGVAVHPDFSKNRFIFLALTAEMGGKRENRVERWKISEDGKRATFDRILLDKIPAHTVHDGGRLRVGPDRHLYVTTGDAGQPSRSQDPGSVAGKLLRMGLAGEIPEDNPVKGSLVYLSGIRNSQGFDWLDAETLVVSDHGPSGELGRRGGDELNVARAGDNLGWPSAWSCEQVAALTAPVLTFVDAAPASGVAVFKGSSIPGWEGSILVSTLGSRHLQRISLTGKEQRRVASHEVYFLGDPPEGLGRLREAIMGPGGLYLTTSNCDGRGHCPNGKDKVLRIVPGA